MKARAVKTVCGAVPLMASALAVAPAALAQAGYPIKAMSTVCFNGGRGATGGPLGPRAGTGPPPR